jgi:hypothetical protein
MYGFVPYNISPIQQGIQFGHGVVEYGIHYGGTPEYQRWSRIDKTFIILNGGTTNTNPLSLGSLNSHASALKMIYGINTTHFYEPDLGDQLTAVVFLVDDRVWDREAWPDYDGDVSSDGTAGTMEWKTWKLKFSNNEEEADRIVKLRNWLKGFRLA